MTNDMITNNHISHRVIGNYFNNLVNSFFKILPMWENSEHTLPVYMKSLQFELLGCNSLISELSENPLYISLLSILEYLISSPDCPISDVKREIFKAISICNKLESEYIGGRK